MMITARNLSFQLSTADGRPSGFDYMRIVLSISVLASHTIVTSYGIEAEKALWASPVGILLRFIVPMFFILSGFLVAGSLDRSKTLIMFMGLRVIRILPALFTEVLISAIIIGPIVNDIPLYNYMHEYKFSMYLLNSIGYISYELPGVFNNNPFPKVVNYQLWTVPYELYCYVFLGMIAIFGLSTRPYLSYISIILFLLIHFVLKMYAHKMNYQPVYANIPPPLLVPYFMCGVTFYVYRNYIYFSKLVFFVCSAASMFLMSGGSFGEYLAVPFIGYITVYLGLCNPKRNVLMKSADYSYGVYLYGFVIQQFVMYIFPDLRHWLANFLICLHLSFLFAAISWHFVEKPALRFRFLINMIEKFFLQNFRSGIRWLNYNKSQSPKAKAPPSRL